jgi:hypothetical protein
MRRAIDTAPRDGKFVILEDDVSGSFELAQWSAEARGWVRENGELSKITPTYWHRTRRDDYLLQEGDEFILQKESGSSGPSASPTYLHPTRRDDFLLQEGDEFILQKQGGSSGPSASREPRSFLFPSGQVAPQRPVATDAGIAPRQVAKPDPVTVARLEARAAQGKSERGPRARRWFAVSSIAATMVAASLIGLYFHAELAAYVTRYTGEQDNVRIGTVGVEVVEQETQVPSQDSQNADPLARDPALHQQADRASSQAPRDSAQVKQGAEAMRPETQQPLETERRRAEALANELARAQQVIETQAALASKARDEAAQVSQAADSGMAELRQSLQREHDRAEALAGELAKARRDIETQLALPSKARDQAAQRNQAAEKATASLRQSLKTEHDRAEALASELTTARTTIYAYEAQALKTSDQAANLKQAAESAALELQMPLQQERERAARLEQDLAAARRDVETQVALSSKRAEEVAQLKQATESATAELLQSLQKEHDRAEALTSELARAQRDTETQRALSGKAGEEAAQVKHAAESATAELRQSLQKEHDRAEALTNDLARARRDLATQVALSSKVGEEAVQVKQAAESATAELRQSLQKEHERGEALTGELARAQRDTETQRALSSKAGDEAAQLKQLKAAESATAELRLSLQKEHERAEALSSELARAQQDTATQVALSSKAGDEAAQVKQVAERATVELRQSLQKEHDRAEALSSELARARRDLETQLALSSKSGDEAAQLKQAAESATAELRQSLQKEHERAEALTGELARARRDIETQVAWSSKAGEEAVQVKKAADSATAELRLSLQKEHERGEALTGELARAQRDIETQVALASKAGDEAAQLKQLKEAAESATAELRQSLQKERDRAEALAPGRGPTQPMIGTRIEVERASNSQIAQVTQTAEAAATEQPAVAEAQVSPEAARLLARASALIGQGNIGAARIVLERAVETGSAQASFMLAETYDPLVLSTWKTFGTHGDVTKARDLYAKALAGGIQEAKDRSVALR